MFLEKKSFVIICLVNDSKLAKSWYLYKIRSKLKKKQKQEVFVFELPAREYSQVMLPIYYHSL